LAYVEFYVPLWCSILYLLISYCKIKQCLKDLPIKHKKIIERLKYYPIILAICFSFATFYRITEMIYGSSLDNQFIFSLLAIIFGNLNGLLNALVYGFTKKVKRLVSASWCPNKKRNKSITEDSNRQNTIPTDSTIQLTDSDTQYEEDLNPEINIKKNLFKLEKLDYHEEIHHLDSSS